jgi:hypothetical protein
MPIEPGDSWFSPKWIEVQLSANGLVEVGTWMGEGARRLPTPTKPRMPRGPLGSETVGAKIHRREGNSPDRQLRSPSLCCSGKGGRIAQTARRLA